MNAEMRRIVTPALIGTPDKSRTDSCVASVSPKIISRGPRIISRPPLLFNLVPHFTMFISNPSHRRPCTIIKNKK